jgi:hypothetical protein
MTLDEEVDVIIAYLEQHGFINRHQ